MIRCVAKHEPQVTPAGLRDKTVGRSQRGVSQRSNGRLVALANRRVANESAEPVSLTGVLEGCEKQVLKRGRKGHPG